MIVLIAILLGTAFCAGQIRGTSLAVGSGTTRGTTTAASLMMQHDDDNDNDALPTKKQPLKYMIPTTATASLVMMSNDADSIASCNPANDCTCAPANGKCRMGVGGTVACPEEYRWWWVANTCTCTDMNLGYTYRNC